MKKFLLLLLLAAGAEAVVGQADPFSRWSVGMETGISVFASCSFCGSAGTHTAPATFQSQYQIFRWLAIPMQLSYHQLNYQRNEVNVWGSSTQSTQSPYDISYEVRNWSFSVGPKLVVPIGQSNIGISIRQGLSVIRLNQKVQNIGLTSLRIPHKLNWGRIMAWRLSYAYKPVEYLAVELSVEQVHIRPVDRFVAKQDLEDLFPDIPETTRLRFLKTDYSAASLNVIFGVHYIFP